MYIKYIPPRLVYIGLSKINTLYFIIRIETKEYQSLSRALAEPERDRETFYYVYTV